MTTILAPRPTKQVPHQMCGFCEAGWARSPAGATTTTAGARAPTTVRPGFNVGRGNGHAVPGEGLFDSGEAVVLPPAAGALAVPER